MRNHYKPGAGELTPEEVGRRFRAAIDEVVLRDKVSITELSRRAGMRRASFHKYMKGEWQPSFARIHHLILTIGLNPQILMPELFEPNNRTH